MGVWGRSPQQGPGGRAPGQRVRGEAPWSWNIFSFWTFTGSRKFVHFSKILKPKKSQIFSVFAKMKFNKLRYSTDSCELIKSNKTLQYKLFTSVYILEYNVNWCKQVRPKLLWKKIWGPWQDLEDLCPPGPNVEPPLFVWCAFLEVIGVCGYFVMLDVVVHLNDAVKYRRHLPFIQYTIRHSSQRGMWYYRIVVSRHGLHLETGGQVKTTHCSLLL